MLNITREIIELNRRGAEGQCKVANKKLNEAEKTSDSELMEKYTKSWGSWVRTYGFWDDLLKLENGLNEVDHLMRSLVEIMNNIGFIVMYEPSEAFPHPHKQIKPFDMIEWLKAKGYWNEDLFNNLYKTEGNTDANGETLYDIF